jgi:WD40 repeat protein
MKNKKHDDRLKSITGDPDEKPEVYVYKTDVSPDEITRRDFITRSLIPPVVFGGIGVVGISGCSKSTDDPQTTDDKKANYGSISEMYHSQAVITVAFSPDGKTLASGSTDKTIKLWSVPYGKPLLTLEGHSSSVCSVVFTPDGTMLASGSDDQSIKLWNITDGTLIKTLEGHFDTVSSVAINPDGNILASGSADKTVRLWSIPEGALIQTFEGHTDNINSVASGWDNARFR